MLAAEIHVSPDGSDDNRRLPPLPSSRWKSTRSGPGRPKGEAGGADQILLHPGTYMIRDAVRVYEGRLRDEKLAAYDQSLERPEGRTSGRNCRRVVVSGWKKSDFRTKTLSSAVGPVFEADLKPLGIQRKFRQIYLNGTRQIWARYPNYDPALPYSGGWAYVDGKRLPMYTDIEGERTDTVVLREKDLRQWSRPTDGEVCIFPRYNWWNRIEKIRDFDPATRTITLEKKMQYAARPEDRYAVFGMKEELDAAGDGIRTSKGEALLPAAWTVGRSGGYRSDVNTILRFENVSNVVLRGWATCRLAGRFVGRLRTGCLESRSSTTWAISPGQASRSAAAGSAQCVAIFGISADMAWKCSPATRSKWRSAIMSWTTATSTTSASSTGTGSA